MVAISCGVRLRRFSLPEGGTVHQSLGRPAWVTGYWKG